MVREQKSVIMDQMARHYRDTSVSSEKKDYIDVQPQEGMSW